MQCLGVLDLAGPLTAGRMAALTGLTTGAVTGVVDRLEKAGFARRAPDPDDRRKVVVHPVPRRRAKVGAMYAPVCDRLGSWCAEHTEQELELVIDYLRASSEVLPDATEALRAKATASRTRGRA